MRIRERRLLSKIEKLHHKLLWKMELQMNEAAYKKAIESYAAYHNHLNLYILAKELSKEK